MLTISLVKSYHNSLTQGDGLRQSVYSGKVERSRGVMDEASQAGAEI